MKWVEYSLECILILSVQYKYEEIMRDEMSWIQSRVYFDIICLVQIWGDKEGWNEVEYSLECILILSV